MPNVETSPLRFGPVSRHWQAHAVIAALLGLVWYVLVILTAKYLGILDFFEIADGRKIAGFWRTHWGYLFLIAMPIVFWAFGTYLCTLNGSLPSLDVIVKGNPTTRLEFTKYLSAKYLHANKCWILPISVGVPIVLTLVADGRDIAAPLTLSWLPASNEPDWSTHGYEVVGHAGPLLYFGFNLLAWSMQIVLAYCAINILLTTLLVLGLVFHDGIGGRRPFELFFPKFHRRPRKRYYPEWSYSTKRCGLEDLDWVFFLLVAIDFLAILICGVSILSNVYLKQGTDVGSFILLLGSVLFIPLTAAWIFVPYFTAFPSKLPDYLKGSPNTVDPSPWPFGSEWFAKGVLTGLFGAWMYLFWKAIEFILTSVNPKAGG